MTEESMIDKLMYACYRRNREQAPNISPDAWAKVLPNGPAMEARYQSEVAAYADAMIQREKRERHEGRPEHDLDVVGRALKAGM